MPAVRVSTRNARFQQWEALLSNRTKRQRAGEFLVQGVRPITMAISHGWPVRTLLYNAEATLSSWAAGTLDAVSAPAAALSPDLMQSLGGKSDTVPELLAVVALPPDDLTRIVPGEGMLVVVLDRPTSPGNIGTVIRSADALGASGVIVTGHAADIYDPKCLRASTGSLFSLPVVRTPSHGQVLEWRSAAGVPLRLVGTDESGDLPINGYDFTQPTVLVVGNETTGLSTSWRESCEHLLRIPIAGAASSLNAAVAASIALYESTRQRGT
jgi:23S rRNA (uridine2479-2'-O)-methyltransferase